MTEDWTKSGPPGLTVHYRGLGTISIEELAHAIVEDLLILKEEFKVSYVRSPRIKVFPTNEYGEDVTIRRPEGGRVTFIDTFHYRPACKDYEL